MRVLLISHTCQSKSEGLPKADELARLSGVKLQVLVPDRWYHYGRWRKPDRPTDLLFSLKVGRIALPWTGPGQFYLHFYPRLRQVLKSFRPDVIDLWEEPWSLVSAHACFLRNRLMPATRIISETEQNIDKHLPPPFGKFRRYTMRHADHVVCRNAEAVQVTRAHGYRGETEVVPNAVDVSHFRPMERDACGRELGLTGFTAGYIGRLVAEKGLDDLIDAVSLCAESVKVVIVGDGPARDDLIARAATRGVSARVRFLAGQPFVSLPRLMNAIDCLVLPSRTTPRWKEQFGRVIIEAHACGTPVIGSNSGAIPDVIGTGGLVVPEQDPSSLASAINRLAADPALARRLGAAGREAVLARYTWRHVAEQMHAIYHRVRRHD